MEGNEKRMALICFSMLCVGNTGLIPNIDTRTHTIKMDLPELYYIAHICDRGAGSIEAVVPLADPKSSQTALPTRNLGRT
jgi:hypothetical protein